MAGAVDPRAPIPLRDCGETLILLPGYPPRMSCNKRRISTLAALVLAAACGTANPYQGMTAEQVYQIAVTEYEEGEYGDAIQARERLMVSFTGFERAEDARMLLADAQFADGNYILARSEYQRFQDRYPTSPRASEAALGVCRSLVALSPIPQRDQDYTEQALGVCRNVAVDYRGSPASEQADSLAEEMRLKLAEKEFLNARFYHRRELFDSAIQYYEFVLELYPDTEWAPQALKGIYEANMAIGYDDLAEEARQRLLQEYPESQAAREIQANGATGLGDEVG